MRRRASPAVAALEGERGISKAAFLSMCMEWVRQADESEHHEGWPLTAPHQ